MDSIKKISHQFSHPRPPQQSNENTQQKHFRMLQLCVCVCTCVFVEVSW